MKAKDVAVDIENEVRELLAIAADAGPETKKKEFKRAVERFGQTLLTLEQDIRSLNLPKVIASHSQRGRLVNKLEREIRAQRKTINRQRETMKALNDTLDAHEKALIEEQTRGDRYERLALGLSEVVFSD